MQLFSLALAFTCVSLTCAMNFNGINPGFLELLRYLSQHNRQFPNFLNSMNFNGLQMPRQPAQPQQPPVYNQQTQPTQPPVQTKTTTKQPVQSTATTQPPTTTKAPVQSQQGTNQATGQHSPVPSAGTGQLTGYPAMQNIPGIPAGPSMPNYPQARTSPDMVLMAAIRRRVARAFLMNRKYTKGQIIPPMGYFPGGIVSSADGSDATVQSRFGPLDIDSFQFCPTEFNCMVVL